MDNNKTGKREYVDIDGKRYKFNCTVFKKAIERVAKNESSGMNRISKDYVISKLAEEILTSSETVRKWQSGNSPSDIDKVKDCAKFLDVDYHMLLISSENKEAHKMTDDERKLIKDIYQGLIDVFYFASEHTQNNEEKGISIRREERERESLQRLELLHRAIDRSALGVPEDTRNKLHKLIIETISAVSCDYYLDERWEKIVCDSVNDLDNPANVIIEYDFVEFGGYQGVEDRNQGLRELGSLCYIWDEISLAEKYGFDDKYIIRVPEEGLEEWDGYVHELDRDPLYLYEEINEDIDSLKDDEGKLPDNIVKRNGKYMKEVLLDDSSKAGIYGFHSVYKDGFEPQFIFMDSVVSILEIIFTHDFPGIEA